MPHDQTARWPQAIREQRADPRRHRHRRAPRRQPRAFRPYPTPLFDEHGVLTGAVNMLIDVTEEQSEALHEQAERCRRLARSLYSRDSTIVLQDMAEGFEQTAAGTFGQGQAQGAGRCSILSGGN